MKCVCPICNSEYENIVTACQVCGFFDKFGINRIFINSEEAELWQNTVVEPYRMKRQFERMGGAFGKQSHELYNIRKQLKEVALWREQAQLRMDRLENMLEEALSAQKPPEAPQPLVLQSIPKAGDIIQFGGLGWRVLTITAGNRVLVISDKILEKQAYHDTLEVRSGVERQITWEKSSLRKYLNKDFLQNFSRVDQSRILITRNATDGSNDTNDYVFLLSLDEARSMLKNNSDRIAQYNSDMSSATSWWWLRSPGRGHHRATLVYGDGHIYVRGSDVSDNGGGVRPAIWINL